MPAGSGWCAQHALTIITCLTGHGLIDGALEAMKLAAFDELANACAFDELAAKIEAV